MRRLLSSLLPLGGLLLAIRAYQTRPGARRRGRLSFDPHRVAYYETEGWRAYYDRRWLDVLILLVRLSQ